MKISRMRLIPAVIGVVGIVGLIGLAGCARLADQSGAVQVPADTSPEAVALAAMGFDTGTAGLEPAAAPSSSAAAPDHAGKRRPLRVELRKNVLHGETVVQTKNGVQTIEVQRGAVTAVTATTVTVKSTDGFTETWTFGPKFTVVHDKAKVATTDIKPGAQIGIAGIKSDAGSTARLAVLP
jgi:hypothetical protein